MVRAEIQPNAEKKRKRRRRRATSRARADSIARTADDITDRRKIAMRRRTATLAVLVPNRKASRVASAVKLKSRSTSALRSKRGRMLITGRVRRICPSTC